MRVLTARKIYRAYPELDKFDDAVCKEYVRHARRSGNAWWGRALIVVVIPTAFILWILTVWLFATLTASASVSLSGILDLVVASIVFTGFFWFPALCALLTRDFTLRRCIRKQISVTGCFSCGYNLIGLTVFDDAENRVVQCPECGTKTVLNQGHITEADINPALLLAES